LNGFGAERDVSLICKEIESKCSVQTLYSGADLRYPIEIEKMVSEGQKAFGSIDILVNNAVVRHRSPVESFSPVRWEEGLAVNLSAAFHTIRLVVPTMKQRRWGRIINMSSILGLRGTVDRVNYVTTKTALIGLTRAVALETIAYGITCNAVCPGTTETPVHESAVLAAMSSEGIAHVDAVRQYLAGKQPTGRFISAEGVAALLVFLCGPESADITGAVLPVDGGWSSM
jgi:3-hydroxybutyrate dehydrogenase